jgi:LmbE family N-acetylglucosaminyl deacetylase
VGHRVTIVSPHYDDVPLSLGQSLLDGALSRCDVQVRIVFGRSNWTTWVHPSPSRTRVVSAWRRVEERMAARRFRYRWSAADWPEALLRWGRLDAGQLLDPDADVSGEPLVAEVADWLRGLTRGGDPPELLLVPAGLGGHVDHRIVAVAAVGIAAELDVPIGYYEDRPYTAHLGTTELRRQLDGLVPGLEPVQVSEPVRAATQAKVRRSYPSQMEDYFVAAMAADLQAGAVERVWFRPGTAPVWFA